MSQSMNVFLMQLVSDATMAILVLCTSFREAKTFQDHSAPEFRFLEKQLVENLHQVVVKMSRATKGLTKHPQNLLDLRAMVQEKDRTTMKAEETILICHVPNVVILVLEWRHLFVSFLSTKNTNTSSIFCVNFLINLLFELMSR